MARNSISFSKYCDELGLPLKNSRWSWCAIDTDRRKALFTIWDNEVWADGKTYKLWDDDTDKERKGNGIGEMKRVVELAAMDGFDAFGVRCFPKYPLTSPRERDYFEEEKLISLVIQKRGKDYIATFKGIVPKAVVAADLPMVDAASRSAIDDLDDLPIGSTLPPRQSYQGSFIVRDERVRRAVIKRARGRCEYCGEFGFKKLNGDRYLEAHHIINLANQGPDTLENVIALCPSHHREAHFGVDSVYLEASFREYLEKIGARKRVLSS